MDNLENYRVLKFTTSMDERNNKRASVSIFDSIDTVSERTKKVLDRTVDPSRRLLIKRFPTLVGLLGVFGISATYYAFERLISLSSYLNTRPHLILLLGVVALFITGRSVKQLFK